MTSDGRAQTQQENFVWVPNSHIAFMTSKIESLEEQNRRFEEKLDVSSFVRLHMYHLKFAYKKCKRLYFISREF
jgi:hypothetical protein